MAYLTESDIEATALAWIDSLGWPVQHGPQTTLGKAA
jgi:hypothetical protein